MVTPIAQSQIASVVNVNNGKGAKAQEVQKPQERVEEIKRDLEQGAYKFDLEKTAEKVAEALI
jgi:anti-sigma28 factor (negative regulator of flagellin synthesis)